MVNGKTISFGVILLAALALGLGVPTGLEPVQAQVLAVVFATLGLWATGLVAPFLASLIFFTAILLLGLADPGVVFSGFTSPAMWLVLSGFVIGAAIGTSGLGARLGAIVAPHLSSSYAGLIAGLMAIGAALGFLMPSSAGRAMVLVPIAMSLADALGFARGSNGRTGVAVAVALGTNVPSFAILPANLPNMVLTGAAHSILGIDISYADYLFLHYPVLGLLKSAAGVLLVLWLFPARADGDAIVAQPAADPAQGRRQGWLLAFLLITLALWSTDRVHGIAPAWIGLATAVVLLMPGIGLVSTQDFRASVDFPTLLLVAGVLGVGAVVSTAGLGEALARLVTGALPLAPGRDFANFVSLSLLATLTSMVATVPGVPAVLTPLAPDLAAATGFPVEAVLMTQVIGFSTPLFPYQVAPLIVAMGLAKEPISALVRVVLALAALTLIVLMPLDFLWWKFLGVL